LFENFYLIKPTPTLIRGSSTIEVTFSTFVERDLKDMQFKINYNSDPDKISDESDYFNNTFMVNLN
jgi:hypothetical protein